jgi:hypothetical protein
MGTRWSHPVVEGADRAPSEHPGSPGSCIGQGKSPGFSSGLLVPHSLQHCQTHQAIPLT